MMIASLFMVWLKLARKFCLICTFFGIRNQFQFQRWCNNVFPTSGTKCTQCVYTNMAYDRRYLKKRRVHRYRGFTFFVPFLYGIYY